MKKPKKTKLKTKKAIQKRMRVSAGGIKVGSACKRHNLRKRPTSMKRKTRGLTDLDITHERMVKKLAPYGLGGSKW